MRPVQAVYEKAGARKGEGASVLPTRLSLQAATLVFSTPHGSSQSVRVGDGRNVGGSADPHGAGEVHLRPTTRNYCDLQPHVAEAESACDHSDEIAGSLLSRDWRWSQRCFDDPREFSGRRNQGKRRKRGGKQRGLHHSRVPSPHQVDVCIRFFSE